jgi:hypothetical protein
MALSYTKASRLSIFFYLFSRSYRFFEVRKYDFYLFFMPVGEKISIIKNTLARVRYLAANQ